MIPEPRGPTPIVPARRRDEPVVRRPAAQPAPRPEHQPAPACDPRRPGPVTTR